jgi:prepilin-type N-terminal cleavage/methylation domain-containing protein
MPSTKRPGVTLIELIIVVTLVGILMAIALPRTAAARTQFTLRQAAVQLQGDLVRARVEAVRRNSPLALTKTGTDAYTIDSIGARTLPSGVTFSSSTASTYVFPAFGPSVSGAQSFNLQLRGYSKVVKVSASGMARIME